MDNPFYWIGISFIITGIFLVWGLPIIIREFPILKSWIPHIIIWYHVASILIAVYIIWYVSTHKIIHEI
jgi:energy-converting hydrogenase Eha subunit A